jgi:thiol-disulfide isomerase/thioredoxin
VLRPLARRRILGALALGATLATAHRPRQAAAAGAADGGLSKLREHETARPLPEGLAFTDGEGQEIRFDTLRGKGLVVNFWATWCPPCVAEMPALDRLHATLAREGVEVLALSSDRGGRNAVAPFYQRIGIRNLAIALDPRGGAGRTLGIRGLPTTILVDRAGLETARLEGEADWDRPELIAAVRRLTRGPARTTIGT